MRILFDFLNVTTLPPSLYGDTNVKYRVQRREGPRISIYLYLYLYIYIYVSIYIDYLYIYSLFIYIYFVPGTWYAFSAARGVEGTTSSIGCA